MTDDGARARDGLNERPADSPGRSLARLLVAKDAEELTRRLNGVLALSGLASHPYGGLYAALRASHAHAPYVELCGAVSLEWAARLTEHLECADSQHSGRDEVTAGAR